MIAGTDYVGLGTLVTAVGATIVSIIVALRQTETHAKLDAVNHKVDTSNGETIGEIVEKNDLLGKTANPPTSPPPGP